MNTSMRSICGLLLRLAILYLFLAPFLESAWALDEIFENYQSTQALSMGDAYTADASGYAALFYNPAGLAKGNRKAWEVTPVALEAIFSTAAVSTAVAGQSLGMYRLFGQLRQHPDRYNYMRYNLVPSVAGKNFGFALLGAYRYAAVYDGSQIDIDAGDDVGATMGGAINLAGNLVKLGAAGKVLFRNQLKGSFDPSVFSSDTATSSLMKEGMGFGADVGLMVSLPKHYLPTLGFAWRDMFNTAFHASHFLNNNASGAPDSIPQSFNVGMSAHPVLGKGVRSTVSVEYKHLERSDLPLRKHLHAGMQIETDRAFYFWVGLNQLYLTAGMALRMRGGNLEVGTYAEDIGAGSASQSDRRMLFRYTIGF